MSDRAGKARMTFAETVEYRLIFTASFTLYILAAGLMRLVPGKEATAYAGAKVSLMSEAWSAAHAAAGYSFMA